MKKPYNIITTPNPILKNTTQPVVIFNDEIKNIANILKDALRDNADYGIGLAANQLGFSNNLFVTEYHDKTGKDEIPLKYFINPHIIEKVSETEILDEGCLSVPNIFLPIKRSIKIKVKAQDINGKHFKLTAKGLFARLIQHETDHLHGILFTDLIKNNILNNYPDLKKFKIIFIGSGDFAEIICRGLILSGLNIPMIITEKGRIAGRNKELKLTEIALMAKAFNKYLIETNDIDSAKTQISKTKPDLIVLADFGQILPKEILNIPKIASINLHPSLLPKYRGPSPIQSAILRGEKNTGISIINMSERIDEGKIIDQKELKILDEDNSYSLEIRLANLGLKMLLTLLPKLQKSIINEVAQDNALSTKTYKFNKSDGEINWTKKPIEIERQIRAFYPWPGSYTFIDNKRLIIHQAHLEKDRLVIDLVQPEGKNIMLFSEYLKGYHGLKPKWFKKIKY